MFCPLHKGMRATKHRFSSVLFSAIFLEPETVAGTKQAWYIFIWWSEWGPAWNASAFWVNIFAQLFESLVDLHLLTPEIFSNLSKEFILHILYHQQRAGLERIGKDGSHERGTRAALECQSRQVAVWACWKTKVRVWDTEVYKCSWVHQTHTFPFSFGQLIFY